MKTIDLLKQGLLDDGINADNILKQGPLAECLIAFCAKVDAGKKEMAQKLVNLEQAAINSDGYKKQLTETEVKLVVSQNEIENLKARIETLKAELATCANQIKSNNR